MTNNLTLFFPHMFRYASITRSIDDGNQLVMHCTFNYRSNAGTELSSVSEYANCNYAQIRNSLGKKIRTKIQKKAKQTCCIYA